MTLAVEWDGKRKISYPVLVRSNCTKTHAAIKYHPFPMTSTQMIINTDFIP